MSSSDNIKRRTYYTWTILVLIIITSISAVIYLSGSNVLDSDIVDAKYYKDPIEEVTEFEVNSNDVLQRPEMYLGQTVTIYSEIEKLGKRAYTINTDDGELLVLTTTDFDNVYDLYLDVLWKIQGDVMILDENEKRKLDEFDLLPKNYKIDDTSPYIKAEHIEKI